MRGRTSPYHRTSPFSRNNLTFSFQHSDMKYDEKLQIFHTRTISTFQPIFWACPPPHINFLFVCVFNVYKKKSSFSYISRAGVARLIAFIVKVKQFLFEPVWDLFHLKLPLKCHDVQFIDFVHSISLILQLINQKKRL